jgi:hypothetical protein
MVFDSEAQQNKSERLEPCGDLLHIEMSDQRQSIVRTVNLA